mmetsp:Transcript_39183/g.58222  ORF Transcript_39183/g.58222 Transcript_39183/m.58222 type:complete len:89 (-) Transcript_39183:510-776(-)
MQRGSDGVGVALPDSRRDWSGGAPVDKPTGGTASISSSSSVRLFVYDIYSSSKHKEERPRRHVVLECTTVRQTLVNQNFNWTYCFAPL